MGITHSPERQIAGWRVLYFERCTPGKQFVGSTFTRSLVTGQRVTDISHYVFADLGYDGGSFQRRSSRGT
jgi:hypothetical protein